MQWPVSGPVNQLEHSVNLEVATLVRLPDALGCRVGISLEPPVAGHRPLKV